MTDQDGRELDMALASYCRADPAATARDSKPAQRAGISIRLSMKCRVAESAARIQYRKIQR